MQSIYDLLVSRDIRPVEFETGSAVLLPGSYELLDRVAEVLKNHLKFKLVVEGHTDDVGGDAVNDQLSLERAGAVKMYLVTKGVWPDYVRVRGYGKHRPLIKDTSERGRALNRRVEARLTTRDWESVF